MDHKQSVNVIYKFLQPVDGGNVDGWSTVFFTCVLAVLIAVYVSGDIAVGDLVHCCVVLGSQQDRSMEGVHVSE